jgi:hypothetical protein
MAIIERQSQLLPILPYLQANEHAIYRLSAVLIDDDGRAFANGWVYITSLAVHYVPIKTKRSGVLFAGKLEDIVGVGSAGRALVVGFDSPGDALVSLPLKISPRRYEAEFRMNLATVYQHVTGQALPEL